MRALKFDRVLGYTETCPEPTPLESEALIRILYGGICSTDLEITRGYMDFSGIPGHEFVGIVERSADKELVGKRVTGEINLACGHCSWCLSGKQNHCPHRTVLGILKKDGVFADFAALPERNLHAVPDAITDEEAVFIEPLAASFEILEQVDIGRADRVCILGDGRLGLLVAQVVTLTGAQVVVVGKHAKKLEIIGRMGIETRLLDPAGSGYDLVIDSTGSAHGINTAVNIVRPGGRIVLKTTVAERGAFDLNRVVINEITIIGSRCGPFEPAIEALKKGTVNVRPLISRVFPIERGVEAFQYAAEKGVLKVLLKIDGAPPAQAA